jgi:hypothetical protein
LRRGFIALAGAATAYVLAAWLVPPGFFDGSAPSEPYRFASPPPQLARQNQPPLPGHGTLRVGTNGQVDPGTIFTGENQPQASLSVLPGSFPAPPDRSPVSVDVKPVSSYPPLTGLDCVTNVYLITASQPLQKEALVTLRFSDALPAPSDIYHAPQNGGAWIIAGSTGASSPFYISTRSTELGYFAGCFKANASATASGPRVGGGQTLPIIVALAILLVVLGGIPLAVMRRRQDPNDEEESGGDEAGNQGRRGRRRDSR